MPAGPRILRVFRFRPEHPEFDGFLRAEMVPDLRRSPGLIDVYVGRRGQDQGGDRVVTTVWTDRASMLEAVGESLETSPFHPERLADTTDRSLDILDLRIALPFELAEPPTLLRLFRGEVRPGELDAYVEETKAGTLADTEAGRGPSVLYLAVDPPDRFVTVSLWPSWPAIEVATGGDIHQPLTTKNTRRLVGMVIAHYEVVG